jgi:hypothetical protein
LDRPCPKEPAVKTILFYGNISFRTAELSDDLHVAEGCLGYDERPCKLLLPVLDRALKESLLVFKGARKESVREPAQDPPERVRVPLHPWHLLCNR